ncbi:hypothetical protein KKC60_02680 [Patescibacteria group bacterium]|nr:hypothetical protein [Patescibacteria group bacterium]
MSASVEKRFSGTEPYEAKIGPKTETKSSPQQRESQQGTLSAVPGEQKDLPPIPELNEDPFEKLSEETEKLRQEHINTARDLKFRNALENFKNKEGVLEIDIANSDIFSNVEYLTRGTSLVLKGTIKESGITVVLKPEAKACIPGKDQYNTEMAELILERHINHTSTPPIEHGNILLDGAPFKGTIQEFVPGKNFSELSKTEVEDFYKNNLEDMERLAFLDMLGLMGDNHQDNCIVTKENKPATIDRGLSLDPKSRKFRSFPARDLSRASKYSNSLKKAREIDPYIQVEPGELLIYENQENPGSLDNHPELKEKITQLANGDKSLFDLLGLYVSQDKLTLIMNQAKMILENPSIQESFEANQKLHGILPLPYYQ